MANSVWAIYKYHGDEMQRKSVPLAVCCVLAFSAFSVTYAATYPRIGGYLIGSPQNYENAQYQAQLARMDFVILNTWPKWQGWSSNGTTLQQAASQIKALNPNIKLFQYEIMDSLGQLNATTAGAFNEPYVKLTASGWWLNSAGSSARILSNWQGGSGGPFYAINISEFTRPDSNGDRWSQWSAKWFVRNYLASNPAVDGLYTDNVSWKPTTQTAGDWNLDGTNDSDGSATVWQWVRQGYGDFLQEVHSLMPNKLQLANLSNWGDPNANLSGLTGRVNGGVIEGIIGPSWAVETWGGWKATLNWYRQAMANVAAPKLVIFHQIGSPSDYQAMRYGLTTCLMDDGYYELVGSSSSSDGDYHTVYWFDEFDASLGDATSTPPAAAWQSGVYRRDFQNGIALVNPKGNGARTVTLEAAYVKLSGKQDPSVNNGQTVTTVTLRDRDGIILRRVQPLKKPAAPPQVSIN